MAVTVGAMALAAKRQPSPPEQQRGHAERHGPSGEPDQHPRVTLPHHPDQIATVRNADQAEEGDETQHTEANATEFIAGVGREPRGTRGATAPIAGGCRALAGAATRHDHHLPFALERGTESTGSAVGRDRWCGHSPPAQCARRCSIYRHRRARWQVFLGAPRGCQTTGSQTGS